MKRRDFMKLFGAIAITPVALLRAKPKTHPVDVLIDLGLPNGKLVAEMREYCDEPIYKAEPFHTGGVVKFPRYCNAGEYAFPNGCTPYLYGITDMKEAQRNQGCLVNIKVKIEERPKNETKAIHKKSN